jgi:predicted small lipoprotein YifL
MIRRFLYLALAVLVVVAIAACGKKGRLEDPPNEQVRFPRVYPAPTAASPPPQAAPPAAPAPLPQPGTILVPDAGPQ